MWQAIPAIISHKTAFKQSVIETITNQEIRNVEKRMHFSEKLPYLWRPGSSAEASLPTIRLYSHIQMTFSHFAKPNQHKMYINIE